MTITVTPKTAANTCSTSSSSASSSGGSKQTLGTSSSASAASTASAQGIAAGGGGCVRPAPSWSDQNPLKYKDASAGAAIRSLPPRPFPLDGDRFGEALIRGVSDLDGKGASTEYGDFKRFVSENWDRMTPDAKAKWRTYEKAAVEGQARGESGIRDFGRVAQDIRSARSTGDYNVDDNSALALLKLEATPGRLSSADCERVFDQLLHNHGGQPFGAMYDAVAEFADRNWDRLPSDMQAAFKAYQHEANRARSIGDAWTSPAELKNLFGILGDAAELQRQSELHRAMSFFRRL